MLYYFSLALLIWLGTGFIAGVRIIFIDRQLNEKNYQKLKDDPNVDDATIEALWNKPRLLAVLTILGLLTFLADTISTYLNEDFITLGFGTSEDDKTK